MALPTITETYNDIFFRAWYSIRDQVIDSIFKVHPVWDRLYERAKTQRGGRKLVIPLEYGTNDTVGFVNPDDTIAISNPNLLTAAEYEWKWLAGSIMRSQAEEQTNRGKDAIINLATIRMENLRKSLIDKLEKALFTAAGSVGTKDIHSLPQLITNDGTGTVGGIDASSNTWWKNQFLNGSSYAAYNFDKALRKIINNCSVYGNDRPDLLIMEQDLYEAYEDLLLGLGGTSSNPRNIWYSSRDSDLSFGGLKLKGATLVWSPSAPSDTVYAINTDYLYWYYDPDYNFEMTDWKPIPNQLGHVAQVVCVGNLVCSKRAVQGVVHSLSNV